MLCLHCPLLPSRVVRRADEGDVPKPQTFPKSKKAPTGRLKNLTVARTCRQFGEAEPKMVATENRTAAYVCT